MTSGSPTIKGVFVNSHINAVRKHRGESGIRTLEQLYGKSVSFRNSDNIPVAEEVRIIELALGIVADRPIPPAERAFEAGRLHFRNFSTTPLGRIIFSMFRKNFKLMMLQSYHVAGHVFQGVKFRPEDLGPTSVRIVMENNDYPLDHFRGLFYEWLLFSGASGSVDARIIPENLYEYTISWR
jgi:uncharacterized protein (TIGR02265 family)